MNGERILVPLDGSALAEEALPYAEALARATGLSLTLFTVVTQEHETLHAEQPEPRAREEAALRSEPLRFLGELVKRCAEHGVSAYNEVGFGNPAEEILIAASLPDTAAIVIATHGRGGLKRLVLGSVADRVMRESVCPVLVVSPRGETAAERGVAGALELRRLVVPLDGSALAEAALPEALGLAEAIGARLTLVRVEPWLNATIGGEGYIPNLPQLEDEAAGVAHRYLEQVEAKLPRGVAVETAILRGTPVECLIAFVAERRSDLIVMTTHGRGGVRRLVLGSVADRLVRSGLPVLLVPAGASAGADPLSTAAASA